MAVSSTSTFNLTIDEIIDRAMARCFGEQMDGYDLRAAKTSLNLFMQELQTRGVNLWTVQENVVIVASMAVADNDITLDASIVDILDLWTRDATTPTAPDDLPVTRIPRATYAMIPNKLDPGRSYQYHLDRQRDAGVIYLYPVNNIASTYSLMANVVRRLYDVGDTATGYLNNVDAPVRFLPTIIAGLAWEISKDHRKKLGEKWVNDLHTDFEAKFYLATNEDTDNAPTRIEVDATVYFHG